VARQQQEWPGSTAVVSVQAVCTPEVTQLNSYEYQLILAAAFGLTDTMMN
jgi:hypothetical protein